MKKNKSKISKKQLTAEKFLHLVPDSTAKTPGERGFQVCPCPKKCSIQGNCMLCTAYHARKGNLPRCERT